MKSYILFFSVLAFGGASAINESAQIINNTNCSLLAKVIVPEFSRADIKFSKLVDAQAMLHQAILKDSVEEVKLALQAGADANQEKDGKSPLLLAVLLKRSNIVEVLLGYIAKINNLNRSLIKDALKLGDFKSALLLVKKGIDISQCMDECMELCLGALNLNPESDNSILELMQELINRGFDMNKIWHLGHNGIYRNTAALKFFIKNGANPNYFITDSGNGSGTWTPLMMEVLRWHPTFGLEVIKILVDAGADINQKSTPFTNPNQPLYGPQTPLAIALAQGKAAVVEFLVKHGASL